MTASPFLAVADATGLDPTVWGPGAVLVGLLLSGVLVPGYLWKQERDERKRLQAIVESILPLAEKMTDALEASAKVTTEAAELIRQHRKPSSRDRT
jgi:hypothetical protein